VRTTHRGNPLVRVQMASVDTDIIDKAKASATSTFCSLKRPHGRIQHKLVEYILYE
jgi:hypothetical protein